MASANHAQWENDKCVIWNMPDQIKWLTLIQTDSSQVIKQRKGGYDSNYMKGPATVFNFWNVSNSNMPLGGTQGDAETIMKPFNFDGDETHTHPSCTWIPRVLLSTIRNSESRQVSEFDFECSHGRAGWATILSSFSHLLWNKWHWGWCSWAEGEQSCSHWYSV